jgi:feruloyl esterase
MLLAALPSFGATCESLSTLRLSNAAVTLSQTVDPGAFAPPTGSPAPFKSLPAFCRVAATLHPSADSDIKVEVWLPLSAAWNGKFEAVGNGGYAGVISYPAMAKALSQGYATASTDTGHSTPGGSFAAGHPEKLVDFGYRAVHELTVQAKAVIKTFYDRNPARSYWNGCSTGGRQALMEAQRFPDDYDGIVAGAPANYMSHLQPWSLWVPKAVHATEESYIPPSKYSVIHKAVLEACDALDGVKDGVIEDPTGCRFDPKVIECDGASNDNCLTGPQVEAARKLYSPATNPRTGDFIFPALEPGSESGWSGLAGPQPMGIPVDTFRFIVYNNPAWDWHNVDFDRDVAAAEKKFAGVVDAVNPDLSRFMDHGGKLIMYHGWNDQLIAPRNSINYFTNVQYTLGTAKTDEAMRLYMVPGMAHCSGGDGTSNFDMIGELDNWVTKNQAPESVVASRANPARTRPLCPFPQVAVYGGSGSSDEAANFSCKTR